MIKKDDAPHRIIASFLHGNCLGVVTEPIMAGGVPEEQRGDLWKVVIGPLDAELARTQPFPHIEYETVVRELQVFLESQAITGQDATVSARSTKTRRRQRKRRRK